jgi:hypothetical protein
MTGGSTGTVFAIAMLAALVLVYGGVRLIVRGERPKGLLMLACAAVMVANVAIWTI